MGLVARQVEADGIPTLSMSSALSITRAVDPPRAAFLDYPLGHTTGKPLDVGLQREIVAASLAAFEELDRPAAVKMLPFRWSDDDEWKRDVMLGGDARTERSSEPVYQSEADRLLVRDRAMCPDCVFP